MKLIYIGPQFYFESGTIMSPFYTEDGARSSLNEIESHLIKGGTVTCRPATAAEVGHYEQKLRELKQRKSNT